jgi:hypothetical protein
MRSLIFSKSGRTVVAVKTFSATIMLAVLAPLALCQSARTQQTAPPTTMELLRILRITTFRVRVPSQNGYTWNMVILPHKDLRPAGTNPPNLTKYTGLLSMRRTGGDKYEFTLPDRGGSYSQGDFDVCKETACDGQYSIKWLKQPTYSADGTQCVLGEFSNEFADQAAPSFIVLVRVRNTLD